MNKWITIKEAIKFLNAEFPFKFDHRKIRKKIKRGELKAINVSSKEHPIWRIKKEWVKEFKNKLKQEISKKPESFRVKKKEKEEAILYPLSKKLGRQVRFKDLRNLPFLTEKQKKVLTLRYGLEDGIFRPYEQVGRLLGLTKQRIIQIENSILKELK